MSADQRGTKPAATKPEGAEYVAVSRLTDKAGAVLAEPGASCLHVPAVSLVWLAQQGIITQKAKE